MLVAPTVTTQEAGGEFKNLEIKALPSGKEYMRYVDAPPAPVPSTRVEAAPEMPWSQGAPGDFSIKLGAVFPNFECKTTKGNFQFHDFLERGDERWTCLL